MTQIIRSLDEIGSGYDVLFCDLWGCLHNGRAPYPAAVAALQDFRRGGGRVVLMTNAPRPRKYVAEQLDRMGVPRDAWDEIVSSGDAAQDAMFAGAVGRRVWAIAQPKDEGFFADIPEEWQDAPPIQRVPLTEAEGIVCCGLFDDLTEAPEDYHTRLFLARERKLKLLCANPDVVVDLGEKRLYCAGALAELYEGLGGEVLYFGKPHAPIYDLARRRLGLDDAARILAVGDGIATDIAGAAGEGIDAIFVTGGLAATEFGTDVENPDPARLQEWLAMRMQAPRFAMGRLR
ncbi:HAD-superfamily class IIA hydrolase, TIGR01459 [Paracoccus aminovorans]|uniref:HAD-superfamily class IIA hydrolase, TIGR01459 n=1 Tax=Paracoccus aminovorans TaxID=34004 RepID=A0A1I2YAG9_9RHOB|nr:TIGR01459 family HAD-type hydrolase [Paracoccus aminovorans]CQR86124.1 HAD family hydrolase [Paracoccus aminovorans]SFH21361.1 HAD-superfamily class IIA hydrolase, TIGR01459 [Paracoccus aminovorans]